MNYKPFLACTRRFFVKANLYNRTGIASCDTCDRRLLEHVLDAGRPDFVLPENTKFEDLPDDWRCPICGATVKMFKPLG